MDALPVAELSSAHVPPVALIDAGQAVEVAKFRPANMIMSSCVVAPLAVVAGVLKGFATELKFTAPVVCGPVFDESRPLKTTTFAVVKLAVPFGGTVTVTVALASFATAHFQNTCWLMVELDAGLTSAVP